MPNATHSCSRPKFWMDGKMLSSMTRASVSLALIMKTLLSSSVGMYGIYKDPAISLLMETFFQTIQIGFRGTQDIRLLGYNNHVWHRNVRNLVSQKVEEVCLVVMFEKNYANLMEVYSCLSLGVDLIWTLFPFWGLMDCTHQRQYVYSWTSCHKHVLWVEHQVLCSPQSSSMILVIVCRPKLNHHWWWRQCLVLGLEVWCWPQEWRPAGISGKHNVFHHNSVQRGRAYSHPGRTPECHILCSDRRWRVLRIVCIPFSLTSAMMALQ